MSATSDRSTDCSSAMSFVVSHRKTAADSVPVMFVSFGSSPHGPFHAEIPPQTTNRCVVRSARAAEGRCKQTWQETPPCLLAQATEPQSGDEKRVRDATSTVDWGVCSPSARVHGRVCVDADGWMRYATMSVACAMGFDHGMRKVHGLGQGGGDIKLKPAHWSETAVGASCSGSLAGHGDGVHSFSKANVQVPARGQRGGNKCH